MKKMIPFAMIAIVALGSPVGCKPSGPPGRSKGNSLGAVDRVGGVTTETLVRSFEQNGFKMIEGTTFEQVVPGDTPSSASVGALALRDTTAIGRNEFFVGVGSDAVFWLETHDGPIDAIADWEEHVGKRIDLVEQLAGNKK